MLSDSEDLLGVAIRALKQQPTSALEIREHLLPSIAAVAERLAANLPKASLLVTSREPLRLSREIVFRLEPLSVPAIDTITKDTATALNYSAVELFAIRAAEASGYKLTSPDLAPVVAICRRLDGLPLECVSSTRPPSRCHFAPRNTLRKPGDGSNGTIPSLRFLTRQSP